MKRRKKEKEQENIVLFGIKVERAGMVQPVKKVKVKVKEMFKVMVPNTKAKQYHWSNVGHKTSSWDSMRFVLRTEACQADGLPEKAKLPGYHLQCPTAAGKSIC